VLTICPPYQCWGAKTLQKKLICKFNPNKKLITQWNFHIKLSFIIWTGWTLAVALSYEDSTINIVVVIIIIIIYCQLTVFLFVVASSCHTNWSMSVISIQRRQQQQQHDVILCKSIRRQVTQWSDAQQLQPCECWRYSTSTSEDSSHVSITWHRYWSRAWTYSVIPARSANLSWGMTLSVTL